MLTGRIINIAIATHTSCSYGLRGSGSVDRKMLVPRRRLQKEEGAVGEGERTARTIGGGKKEEPLGGLFVKLKEQTIAETLSVSVICAR